MHFSRLRVLQLNFYELGIEINVSEDKRMMDDDEGDDEEKKAACPAVRSIGFMTKGVEKRTRREWTGISPRENARTTTPFK